MPASASKILAECKAGELLKGMEKAKGARTDKQPAYTKKAGLAAVGLSEVTAHRWQTMAPAAPQVLGASVEAKLTAQREFVVWWDGHGHDKAGRPKSSQTGNDLIAGQNGLPDRLTLHRWRIRRKVAKAARDRRIFDLWLACWTLEEIAEETGCSQGEIAKSIPSGDLADLNKSDRALAEHATDFDPPPYNVWTQQEKTEGSSGRDRA